jgi:hypothetical protein
MNPFHFYTKLDQTLLLGRSAKNITELLEGVASVPDGSIYYHTHHYLQQHHFLSPEPPNDFAYWVRGMLNDSELAEQLSSVDIMSFANLSDLRREFTGVIEDHTKHLEKVTDCARGQEFHFMSCRTYALPTSHVARSLHEFLSFLKQVSVNSLYYHIFDARMRLGRNENDFSRWFRDMGLDSLADSVARLDPYTYTLEGLRNSILTLGIKYDSN